MERSESIENFCANGDFDLEVQDRASVSLEGALEQKIASVLLEWVRDMCLAAMIVLVFVLATRWWLFGILVYISFGLTTLIYRLALVGFKRISSLVSRNYADRAAQILQEYDLRYNA